MMHTHEPDFAFWSSTLLFHDRTRFEAIDLGNEILAAEDSCNEVKIFCGNCLVDVTKSVLVLGKPIYDQSISDAICFFLDNHRRR